VKPSSRGRCAERPLPLLPRRRIDDESARIDDGRSESTMGGGDPWVARWQPPSPRVGRCRFAGDARCWCRGREARGRGAAAAAESHRGWLARSLTQLKAEDPTIGDLTLRSHSAAASFPRRPRAHLCGVGLLRPRTPRQGGAQQQACAPNSRRRTRAAARRAARPPTHGRGPLSPPPCGRENQPPGGCLRRCTKLLEPPLCLGQVRFSLLSVEY
jgi:hypothetical protein